MKKYILLISFLFIGNILFAQDILPKPNPPKLVTDAANVLSPEQREILEQKLVALDDSTSNQIAIVTIPTTGDYPIEVYSIKMLRDWGIGGSKHNNGVLVLVAVNDHKIRIEVGYGLEGAIPDITASSIIDNDLSPNFREGNYYRGFDEAINSLSKAAVGEYNEKRQKDDGGGGSLLTFILILIVVLIIVGNMGGGGGSGMMSRRGYRGLNVPPIWLGGGGFGGGGGGGGFGGGGGGFGGFGGGGGGGGGASGGW